MSLEDFLREKPLYYTEIDYTRMPRVYAKINSYFQATNIIHIIGTNGKGTTGRFLASALYHLGYKTAHYTSPHILEFNERIWLNGQNASYEALEREHQKLQTILSKEDSDSLSYFEYTTFVAMMVFNDCDYIILEAGLGGEYDATAVFPKKLTLVTPIAYDHESFLGNTIEQIAKTKLNAVQNSSIIAKQEYQAVYDIAVGLEFEKNIRNYCISEFLDEDDKQKIEEIVKKLNLVAYLEDNLRLSIACLKFLKIPYGVDNFEGAQLFGRLTKFKENILLDVGHNPLAASSIVKALKSKKYTLIYNTYKDKEYKKILQILKPIIKDVEIIEIDEPRIELKEQLQNTLTNLEIKYKTFQTVEKSKNYLVFGSFAVVETFLKVYGE